MTDPNDTKKNDTKKNTWKAKLEERRDLQVPPATEIRKEVEERLDTEAEYEALKKTPDKEIGALARASLLEAKRAGMEEAEALREVYAQLKAKVRKAAAED